VKFLYFFTLFFAVIFKSYAPPTLEKFVLEEEYSYRDLYKILEDEKYGILDATSENLLPEFFSLPPNILSLIISVKNFNRIDLSGTSLVMLEIRDPVSAHVPTLFLDFHLYLRTYNSFKVEQLFVTMPKLHFINYRAFSALSGFKGLEKLTLNCPNLKSIKSVKDGKSSVKKFCKEIVLNCPKLEEISDHFFCGKKYELVCSKDNGKKYQMFFDFPKLKLFDFNNFFNEFLPGNNGITQITLILPQLEGNLHFSKAEPLNSLIIFAPKIIEFEAEFFAKNIMIFIENAEKFSLSLVSNSQNDLTKKSIANFSIFAPKAEINDSNFCFIIDEMFKNFEDNASYGQKSGIILNLLTLFVAEIKNWNFLKGIEKIDNFHIVAQKILRFPEVENLPRTIKCASFEGEEGEDSCEVVSQELVKSLYNCAKMVSTSKYAKLMIMSEKWQYLAAALNVI